MISKDDLVFALDNSTPYPIELGAIHPDLMSIMADKLMAFCVIEKNESDPIWAPEPEEPETPGPEIPTTPPPGPHDD